MNRSSVRYRSHKDPQEALRRRLRELAASRVRYGYRRLAVMLQREGWPVNTKRIYRLYCEEGLSVRSQPRKKLASRVRVTPLAVSQPNERWSMDFNQRSTDEWPTISRTDGRGPVHARMRGTCCRSFNERGQSGRRLRQSPARTKGHAGQHHRRQWQRIFQQMPGCVGYQKRCDIGFLFDLGARLKTASSNRSTVDYAMSS